MKKGIFLYTIPPDIRPVMSGPRLSITFDEGAEIPRTFEEQIELLRPKLEAPETIEHLIDELCLLEDKFDKDPTFKFTSVQYKDCRISYLFTNKDDDTIEIPLLIERSYVI